ncbi:MAG: hypothetical protein IKH91_07995 [Prevotella sp.]|nr:hypothetical protein [Prevotella sp.]
MKRYIFTLAAFILGVAQMNAQNFVFDEVVEIPQGGKAPVAIKYVTGGKTITSYSFNFVLPEGLSLTQGKAGMEWVMDAKNEGFTTMPYETTGMACLSPNVASIYLDGTEGTLGTVSLEADASLEINTELSVTVNTLQLVEYTSEGTYVTTNVDPITFKVKIVDNRITLDENSTEAPTASGTQNVLVKRTIKAGNWSTICLPFAMTGDQIKEAFGDGVEFADFTGYTATYDEDDFVESIEVSFSSVNTSAGIEANHPYIIKVSDNITEFKLDNVEVNVGEEPLVHFGTTRKFKDFVGTYAVINNLGSEEPCLFLSGNKFYYATGKTKIKAYRAYFAFYEFLKEFDPEASAKVNITVDGEATSIDGMNFQHITEGVYDLSGRKIQLQDGDLNKLQKGVYIINGKKVTIK